MVPIFHSSYLISVFIRLHTAKQSRYAKTKPRFKTQLFGNIIRSPRIGIYIKLPSEIWQYINARSIKVRAGPDQVTQLRTGHDRKIFRQLISCQQGKRDVSKTYSSAGIEIRWRKPIATYRIQ